MPNYPLRYRCNPVPHLHNAMSNELCDKRTFNELKRVQFDYGWKWWDGPAKNRDRKSWKRRTKQRHQYRTVEF